MNFFRSAFVIVICCLLSGCIGRSRQDFDPRSMSSADQAKYFMRSGLDSMERGFDADRKTQAAQEFDSAIFAFSRAHDAYLNRLLEVKEGEKATVEKEIDKVQRFLYVCRKERPAVKDDLKQ